jgi:hypothetical protein
LLPRAWDLRYNWVVVQMAAIDAAEMRDLVLDAWAMCVPKRVAAEYRSAEAGVRDVPFASQREDASPPVPSRSASTEGVDRATRAVIQHPGTIES